MKNKYFTNQQLLEELKERLPEFTQEEFSVLMSIISPYQQEIMKLIQLVNPKVTDWIEEKTQELKQEKNDEEIKKIKESLK